MTSRYRKRPRELFRTTYAEAPNGCVPVKTAARHLQLTEQTVYQMISRGELSSIRKGHRIFLPEYELSAPDNFMDIQQASTELNVVPKTILDNLEYLGSIKKGDKTYVSEEIVMQISDIKKQNGKHSIRRILKSLKTNPQAIS